MDSRRRSTLESGAGFGAGAGAGVEVEVGDEPGGAEREVSAPAPAPAPVPPAPIISHMDDQADRRESYRMVDRTSVRNGTS